MNASGQIFQVLEGEASLGGVFFYPARDIEIPWANVYDFQGALDQEVKMVAAVHYRGDCDVQCSEDIMQFQVIRDGRFLPMNQFSAQLGKTNLIPLFTQFSSSHNQIVIGVFWRNFRDEKCQETQKCEILTRLIADPLSPLQSASASDGPCPDDALLYGGQCAWLTPTSMMSWTDADAACRSTGGTLAKSRSYAMQQWAKHILWRTSQHPSSLFLGIRKQVSNFKFKSDDYFYF
jgi:hypothetical protein